jgi:hypothetical protein
MAGSKKKIPKSIVLVSILKYHLYGDLKLVDDVAINKALTNEEAN